MFKLKDFLKKLQIHANVVEDDGIKLRYEEAIKNVKNAIHAINHHHDRLVYCCGIIIELDTVTKLHSKYIEKINTSCENEINILKKESPTYESKNLASIVAYIKHQDKINNLYDKSNSTSLLKFQLIENNMCFITSLLTVQTYIETENQHDNWYVENERSATINEIKRRFVKSFTNAPGSIPFIGNAISAIKAVFDLYVDTEIDALKIVSKRLKEIDIINNKFPYYISITENSIYSIENIVDCVESKLENTKINYNKVKNTLIFTSQ